MEIHLRQIQLDTLNQYDQYLSKLYPKQNYIVGTYSHNYYSFEDDLVQVSGYGRYDTFWLESGDIDNPKATFEEVKNELERLHLKEINYKKYYAFLDELRLSKITPTLMLVYFLEKTYSLETSEAHNVVRLWTENKILKKRMEEYHVRKN